MACLCTNATRNWLNASIYQKFKFTNILKNYILNRGQFFQLKFVNARWYFLYEGQHEIVYCEKIYACDVDLELN